MIKKAVNSKSLIKAEKYIMFLRKIVVCITLIATLSGCDTMFNKLNEVGKVPEMSGMSLYEAPKDMPPENDYGYVKTKSNPNSLWQGAKKSFFKTKSVGDVLSVVVHISDKAKLSNQTQKARNTGTKIGAPSILGMETVLNKVLPSSSAAKDLVNINSKDSSNGNGKVDRNETIQTTIAVIVINILPSGNLVIKGKQEVRVNFDIREITIEGIVRPEDIASDNTVQLEQIAEARVSYGGRGQIFEYQQAPYGKQVVDIVSPF